MGADPVTIGIVAAAVGAAGTAYSTIESQSAQRKARNAQQDAADTQSAQQKQEQLDQQRQQIRQQRIRTAQIQQAAANTGTSMSSSEAGSTSAIGTNAGANIATLSSRMNTANAISSDNQKAANSMASAGTWNAIGQLSGTMMNLGIQGYAAYSKVTPAATPAKVSAVPGTFDTQA